MKIVYLVAGAGETFYCGNCLRDSGLIPALRKAGHEILTVPLYLPLALDEPDPPTNAPVFFGGINVYLQQKLSVFRRTPRWVDRLLDSPRLLKWVSRKSGMTNPRDLSEITISMLRGEQGRQRKELERLVAWLESTPRPDVIFLSNALLLGLAGPLKAKLDVPVICMLQDEDIFLDALPDPYRRCAWETLAVRAADAEAFIAVSKYYRETMIDRLHLPPERVQVVYTGLERDSYTPPDASPDPPSVGFLERMCPEKGLDILIEAFLILKSDPRFERLKLRVAGGKTGADEPYVVRCRKRLKRSGWAPDVEFVQKFDRSSRIAFLQSLSVLSVPARHREAFGLYILEALAAGVPVVQPSEGAFPEILKATGGGVLYEPNDAGSLARALGKLLTDTDRARELGRRGRAVVLERFTMDNMTAGFLRVCKQLCEEYEALRKDAGHPIREDHRV